MKLYLLVMVIMTLVFAQEDYTSDDPEKNPNKKDEL
mgnify:CR=1 FL=1